MRNFLIKLSLFSITVAVIVFCWNHFAPEKFYVEDIWLVFGFFILATSAVHYWMVSAAKKKPGQFVNNFMAVTGIKLFLFMIILLVYCLLNRTNAIPFAIGFLVLYFLFSAFEVTALIRNFRN